MKAKTLLSNVFQKQTLRKIICVNDLFSSVKSKDVIKDLIDLAHLQSKVKQIKLEKKIS